MPPPGDSTESPGGGWVAAVSGCEVCWKRSGAVMDEGKSGRGESGAGRSATCAPFRAALALALGVAAVVASGCGEKKLPFEPTVSPTPNPSATFTRVQNEIFTANCAIAGCHASLGPQQGMSLAAGAAYGNIVRVHSVERPDLNRIEPGSPDRSYMVKKLRGDPDITGLRMPNGGTLTAAQIQLVIDWVQRGAPQD